MKKIKINTRLIPHEIMFIMKDSKFIRHELPTESNCSFLSDVTNNMWPRLMNESRPPAFLVMGVFNAMHG